MHTTSWSLDHLRRGRKWFNWIISPQEDLLNGLGWICHCNAYRLISQSTIPGIKAGVNTFGWLRPSLINQTAFCSQRPTSFSLHPQIIHYTFFTIPKPRFTSSRSHKSENAVVLLVGGEISKNTFNNVKLRLSCEHRAARKTRNSLWIRQARICMRLGRAASRQIHISIGEKYERCHE